MLRRLIIVAVALCSSLAHAQAATAWQARLAQEMPLLGHRNWILVVDSAYPLQTSPGVETVDTGESQEAVTKYVLGAINHSIQVKPFIFMDAELPLVPDADAPGVSTYRQHIKALLQGLPVTFLPHDQIIQNIDDAGKTFHVLVLKTSMTIPYTSVFLRLDCKYWTAEAEQKLRSRIAAQKQQ